MAPVTETISSATPDYPHADEPVSTMTIAQALDIMGWTATQLADKAKVKVATVMRAMMGGSQYRTNYSSALAIAEALGLEVNEIEWANGLSHLGRPAHTGRPIDRTNPRTKLVKPSTAGDRYGDGQLYKKKHHHLEEELCPTHHVFLPLTKQCDQC